MKTAKRCPKCRSKDIKKLSDGTILCKNRDCLEVTYHGALSIKETKSKQEVLK